MIKINKMTDYAMLLMVHIYSQPKHVFSSQQLGGEIPIGKASISKLCKLLHNANLLESQRGATGGYHACKSPCDISLADIMVAINLQSVALTACVEQADCNIKTSCHLQNRWQIVNDAIANILNEITLQDMIDNTVHRFININQKQVNVAYQQETTQENQYG